MLGEGGGVLKQLLKETSCSHFYEVVVPSDGGDAKEAMTLLSVPPPSLAVRQQCNVPI